MSIVQIPDRSLNKKTWTLLNSTGTSISLVGYTSLTISNLPIKKKLLIMLDGVSLGSSQGSGVVVRINGVGNANSEYTATGMVFTVSSQLLNGAGAGTLGGLYGGIRAFTFNAADSGTGSQGGYIIIDDADSVNGFKSFQTQGYTAQPGGASGAEAFNIAGIYSGDTAPVTSLTIGTGHSYSQNYTFDSGSVLIYGSE